VSRISGFIVPGVIATIALVGLLAIKPLPTSRALAIWILFLAAIVLVALVRRAGGGDGPRETRRFENALRIRTPAPKPPAELARMERTLELGVFSELHAQRHVLPLLRAAAAARLAAKHGVELERRPEVARELLGEETWDLIRPDRPEPEDRHAPGIPRPRLAAAIARLESL